MTTLLLESVHGAVREALDSGLYPSLGRLRAAPSLVSALKAVHASGKVARVAEFEAAVGGRGVAGRLDLLAAQIPPAEACAWSVVARPPHTREGLDLVRRFVRSDRPVLLNDFVLTERQIDWAASVGVSAVTLPLPVLSQARLGGLAEYARLAEREIVVLVTGPDRLADALVAEPDAVLIEALEPTHVVGLAASLPPDLPILCRGGLDSPSALRAVEPVVQAVLLPVAPNRRAWSPALDPGPARATGRAPAA